MNECERDAANNVLVNAAITARVCRTCGYDLSGVSLTLCPECGAESPHPTATADAGPTRAGIPSTGPVCTRCGQRASASEDGACVCGATFGRCKTRHSRDPGEFVDALAVIAAILGAGVALFA
ncbi:MAG: hypothetical protein ACOYN0_10950, partial [Phycisphaerales bacterium]